MEIEKHQVISELREIYQSYCDKQQDLGRDVITAHFGEFSRELITSLSKGVEDLLISVDDKRVVIKRMFSILIEGMQNIRHHGVEDALGRRIGYLVISSSEDAYVISMANLIDPKDTEKVSSFIDEINGYSKDELKKTYLSVLSNEFFSEKGGAGLGFITKRMRSNNPLGYAYYDLPEDKQLFAIEVTLNRKNGK